MEGVWSIPVGCLEGFKRVSRGCLLGVWLGPAAYLESVNIGLDKKFCKEKKLIRFHDFEYFQSSKNLRKTLTWISSVVLLSHTCEILLLVLCAGLLSGYYLSSLLNYLVVSHIDLYSPSHLTHTLYIHSQHITIHLIYYIYPLTIHSLQSYNTYKTMNTKVVLHV